MNTSLIPSSRIVPNLGGETPSAQAGWIDPALPLPPPANPSAGRIVWRPHHPGLKGDSGEGMFPFPGFAQIYETSGTGNNMAANLRLKIYGELLGMELFAQGVAVLLFPPCDDDPLLWAAAASAIWAGLRAQGVAMALPLPVSSQGIPHWEAASELLATGIPFITVAAPWATPEILDRLLVRERLAGVAVVDQREAAVHRPDEVAAWLEQGWHQIILPQTAPPPLLDEALLAQGDATARIAKRYGQLLAAPGRGDGAAALHSDPGYQARRRVLAAKLGIPTPGA